MADRSNMLKARVAASITDYLRDSLTPTKHAQLLDSLYGILDDELARMGLAGRPDQ